MVECDESKSNFKTDEIDRSHPHERGLIANENCNCMCVRKNTSPPLRSAIYLYQTKWSIKHSIHTYIAYIHTVHTMGASTSHLCIDILKP